MTRQILKRLFYSFLVATTVSLTISWTNYQSTNGLEARQGMFLVLILTFILCIANFILSLPAFLNAKPDVRNNIFISALTFGGLPLLLLILIGILNMTNKSNSNTPFSFLTFGGPSIFYLCALAYNFYKFQQTIE
ncbi:MAG: hypothetical protein ACXVPU_05575 [Bacteroidia bacterium]